MAGRAGRPVLIALARLTLAAACLCAVATTARAQAVPASTLKAAYLLNFVKFTEWPPASPELPILLCVHGADVIADALTRTASGQTIDGRAVRVARIAAAGTARSCQMLFVSGAPADAAPVLQQTAGLPILTVGDVGQATSSSMITFFLEDDRLRFAINLDLTQRAGIKISSRVLTLAKIIRSGPGAP